MANKNVKCNKESHFKQKAVVKFSTQESSEEVPAISIHWHLEPFYGDQTLDSGTVCKGLRLAREQSLNLFYKPRSGHPKSRQSEDWKMKVDEKIQSSWWITQRQLENEIGISLGSINKTVKNSGF